MGWRTHLGMGKYAHGGVHYLDLTDESRARQIQINKDTLARLDRMFEQTAKELAEKAARAGPDSLTRRWALDYEKEVRAVLENMRSTQFDITRDGMKKAAENGTYVQHKVFSVIDEKYALGLSERFTSVLSHVPEAALNEILSGKIYTDGAGLSKRIWRDTKGLENDIGYIIEQALLQKKSAVNLAADLEQYVNGDARTNYSWGNCYPQLRSKQCSYEAQRLARTSINHAYQLSTVRAAKDNPYIDGLQWMSALSARTCKLCWERDGWIFPVNRVPLDHPNGLCTFAPYIPKGMDEIGSELKDWVKGKDNPKLDKWLGKVDNGGGSGIIKIDNPVNAKTIQEAEEWAAKHLHFKDASYKGIDVAVANQVNAYLQNLYADYPFLEGFVQNVKTDGRIKAVANASLSFNGQSLSTSLTLSKKALKDLAEIDRMVADCVNAKWWAPKDGLNGIIQHEMGHMIEYATALKEAGAIDSSGMLVDAAKVNDAFRALRRETISSEIKRQALMNLNITGTDADIVNNLGKYACENAQEFLAEAFSEHNPRPLAKEVVSLLNKKVKDVWK